MVTNVKRGTRQSALLHHCMDK